MSGASPTSVTNSRKNPTDVSRAIAAYSKKKLPLPTVHACGARIKGARGPPSIDRLANLGCLHGICGGLSIFGDSSIFRSQHCHVFRLLVGVCYRRTVRRL